MTGVHDELGLHIADIHCCLQMCANIKYKQSVLKQMKQNFSDYEKNFKSKNYINTINTILKLEPVDIIKNNWSISWTTKISFINKNSFTNKNSFKQWPDKCYKKSKYCKY